MTNTRISIALLLAFSLVQAGSAQQQPPEQQPARGQAQQQDPQPVATGKPQPTFRAGINFVRVDVIVSDKKGAPVADLTAKDFEIVEDGKPQTIEQFRLIRVDGNAPPGDLPPRQIRSKFDEETEAAREDVRVFVIFFDDYHTRVGSAMSVKEPLTKFVQNQLGPNDLIALMYPLSPLDTVTLSRNHASIVAAIQKFEGRKFRYEPRNDFEQRYAQYPSEIVEQIRNQVVMTALRGLATRLGSLREGRKAIIFVSEGFTAMLPPQMRDPVAMLPGVGNRRRGDPFAGRGDPREETAQFFAETDLQSQMRDVYDAANRNNAAFYALDPRGLATGEFHIDENIAFERDQRSLQSTQDTLRILATETDGRAIVNRNDLTKGLEQVVRDSSAYYLIGYNSSGAPSDGKFHEIKVRVKRPGVDVRARKGYWAPTPDDTARATAGPKPEAPKAVQQALASMVRPTASGGYIRTWVGTSRAENGKTRVTFVWEPLAARPGERRDQAGRVSVIAAGSSGDLVFRGRVPDLAFASAGTSASGGASTGTTRMPAASPATGPQRLVFDAPPGKLELRLSVESAIGGGVLDTEIQDVTVPDLSGASAISTPRVYRARTARDFQTISRDADAVPVASRDFSRTDRLLIRFDVYANGVTPTATLLNRNGQKMAEVPITAATAGGTHQIDFGLGSIPPGEYLIEIAAQGAKELVPLKIGS
jgi:VWFA-related protein